MSLEPIALCIATRDRPEHVERYLVTSLRALRPETRVVVVDQSTNDETAEQLRALEGVEYLRTQEVGLSRARNIAIGVTDAPLLALTDDDIAFDQAWLDHLVDVFAAHPDAGAVCTRSIHPDGSRERGAARAAGVYRRPTSPFGLGVGFNTALRRAAVDSVGLYDVELGAGSAFHSAEDTDMLYRVLRAGWSVVCTDDVTLVHHDSAVGSAALRRSFRYGIGVGAQTAKHRAAGDPQAIGLALKLQLPDLAAAATVAQGAGRRTLKQTLHELRPRYGLQHVLFTAGTFVGYVRWRSAHRA